MSTKETCIADLVDARARLLTYFEDLSDDALRVPKLAILNPPLWEVGHVAWFQERWTARNLGGLSPVRADADALWDSTAVAHSARWDLPLPVRAETLSYMRTVLERVTARLETQPFDAREEYFHRLVTFHEDMHGEALVYTRQTVALPAPRVRGATLFGGGPHPGDVEIPGGSFDLGAPRDLAFVFDNEKWAHPVTLAPYRIARAPVTQAEFAEFVEAGGYARDAWWTTAGLRWRDSIAAWRPVYWERESNGRWMRRHFDRWVPLEDHKPVVHVNAHEAEAYCTFAGRRLPTEAEWELAAGGAPHSARSRTRSFPWGDEPPDASLAHLDLASADCCEVGAFPLGDSPYGCRQMIGNIWEWTASDFLAYAGFSADPYREYSEPWFGTHRVLRGGSHATRARLVRNTWRNFYTPDRRDVLAGFRTCAR